MAALRTISLRLRGTSTKELEEAGEDTTGVVTSKSKLRGKVKSLSGVDILTDTGSYKSTYEILLEISKVWEDMSDIDQAALLEIIAGKTRSNTAAAILSNTKDLEEAYVQALEAEGSAYEENEKYLDSIQGKIDLFTNAVQTMWNNALNSDVVKGFVSLGTELIKIIDKIGLINSLLIGFGVFATKKYNLFGNIFGNTKDIKSIREEYKELEQKANEASEAFAKNPNKKNEQKRDRAIKIRDDFYDINLKSQDELINKQTAAQEKLDKAKKRLANAQAKEGTANAVSAATMKKYESAVRSAEKEVDNLNEELKEKIVVDKVDQQTTEGKTASTLKELATQILSGKVTKENIAATLKQILVNKLANTALGERIAATLGVTTAELVSIPITKLLTVGFTELATAIWTALAPFLPFIAATAALVGAVALVAYGIDEVVTTAAEAKEKLEELNSEINSLTSDLDSLNSQLETTQERMEELLSKDSLSFVEQEELNNLKLQNEQLEKQIELQKLLIEDKKKLRTDTAKDVIEKTWDSKSYGKEDYQVDAEGVIKHDSFWGFGQSGKDAVDEGIERYSNTKKIRDAAYDSYVDALNNNGSEDFITKIRKQAYDVQQDLLTRQEEGINLVLGDMAKVITENELQYGDDSESNKYLDEYYARSLKWQGAQGAANKSDIIKHIFSDSTSDSTQNLKKQLDEIAASGWDSAKKQTEAQKLIQDAIDSTDEDYQRFQTTIETLKMSVEELAESFIAISNAPDISTFGGVLEIFADGEEILRKFNDKKAQLGLDENGEAVTWGNLFKEVDGEKVADNLKVAAILEGADESVRNQFTKLIEEIESGKMSVDEALANWEMTGIDKAVEVLNTEFESLNNEMFPDAADEISGLIDSVNELKAAFESVASTMDLLHTAQTQFNNSGRVSVKTALELMSSTDEWDKVLNITEDSITLADGAEQALIQTQLDAIATQSKRAEKLAKTKYEAALAAQKARELSDAERGVAATQNSANAVTNQRTNQMGGLATQTYNTAISELDYAGNDGVVQTAESVKARAIGLVSASIVGLDAAIQAFTSSSFGNRFSSAAKAWSSAYGEVRSAVVTDANSYTTTVGALKKDYENKRDVANVAANADKYGEFRDNYDFDKTPGDKYKDDSSSDKDDAFQKAMDYWENRISANQARYEQLQNEIDLLEKQGKIAGKEYYKEQIKLENQRLKLLEAQKAEAKKFLGTFKEGSDEWWEAAQKLNDIEGEIDSVTNSIQDLNDAIDQIHWDIFDESHERFDDLIGQLGTVRDLLSADEDSFFDDAGQFAENGVAVLGTYIQEIEIYKNALKNVNNELANLKLADFDSEQEYYDKLQELLEKQSEYTSAISDSEQAVVDMYESQIDAIEEYTNELVDSYNEYIDVVKEALDAERELYEFKKDVEKQAKDIATIERRIASLSGSTDASDIAERRKLEAELYEAKEGLDDTYYSHAKDAQQNALDDEASAYEEHLTTYIETLREKLDEAKLNMDLFMQQVTTVVTMNADTVLNKYTETGISIDTALTTPWKHAAEAMKNYETNNLALMNSWTQAGANGYFYNFQQNATNQLKSPWSAGTSAANTFKDDIKTAMDNVVSTIKNNVATAKSQLSSLYTQIQDTSQRASSVSASSGGSSGGGYTGGGYSSGGTFSPNVKALQEVLNSVFSAGLTADGVWGPKTEAALKKAQTNIKNFLGSKGYRDLLTVNGKFDSKTRQNMLTYFNLMSNIAQSNDHPEAVQTYVNARKKLPAAFHAKGTLGTKRDEWAITDESWIGEEITLAAGKHGQLQYLKKGSAVMPADISANLIEWGKLNPNALTMPTMGGGVNIMSNAVIQPNYEFNFDSLVHVDHCDEGTLKGLEKMVDNKLDYFSKQLNYSIKKFAR